MGRRRAETNQEVKPRAGTLSTWARHPVLLALALLVATAASAKAIGSSAGTDIAATANQQFSGEVATFQSAPAQADPGNYTAHIGWGDGMYSVGTVTTKSGGATATLGVTGTHTYATAGSFTVNVSILESDDSSSALTTSTATVSQPSTSPTPTPAPPITAPTPTPPMSTTPAVTPAPAVTQGAAAVQLVDKLPGRLQAGRKAYFGLPAVAGQPAAAFYLWDFGDGTRGSAPIGGFRYLSGVPSFDSVVTHVYRKRGAYPVVARVVGKDGQTATVGTTVLVGGAQSLPLANHANLVIHPWKPTWTPAIRDFNEPFHVGDQVEVTADGYYPGHSDVGQLIRFADGLWSWGDGSVTDTTGFIEPSDGKPTSDAKHRYTSPGTKTITLSVWSPIYGDIKVETKIFVSDQVCAPMSVRGVVVTPHPCFDKMADGELVAPPGQALDVGGFQIASTMVGSNAARPAIDEKTGTVKPWIPPHNSGAGDYGLVVSLAGRELGQVPGFGLPANKSGVVAGVVGKRPFTSFGSPGPTVGGLPVVSGVMNMVAHTARVDVQLPDPFKGTEAVDLSGAAHAASAGDLHMGPFSTQFGPFGVNNVVLDHDATGWQGSGNLDLGVLGTIKDAKLALNADGSFKYADATLAPPSPILPILLGSTGAELETIEAAVTKSPFEISGKFDLGFPSPTPFLKIPQACIGFAHYAPGGPVPSLCGEADAGAANDYWLHASGQLLTLEDTISLASAEVNFHTAPAGFTFSGTWPGFDIVPGLVHVDGSASGWLQFNPRAFEADVTGHISTPLGGPSATGVISSIGVSACGDIDIGFDLPFGGPHVAINVSVGGQYLYHGGANYFVYGCDTRVGTHVAAASAARAAPGRARASAAASALHAQLTGGIAMTILAIGGQDGAPTVHLLGPKGEQVNDAGADVTGSGHAYLIAHVKQGKVTYVYLPRASAGLWTITATPGSTPLTQATVNIQIPRPQILPSISGSAHDRRLHYKISPQVGQTVQFIERGQGGGESPIGTARGNQGTLSFHPGPGPAGKRTIFALVNQDGHPRSVLKVGSYNAPPPIVPARVGGLTLRRHGTSLLASWRGAANATGYAITIRTGDHRETTANLGASARSYSLPEFFPLDSATVSIHATDRLGKPGPETTAGMRPSGRPVPLAV